LDFVSYGNLPEDSNFISYGNFCLEPGSEEFYILRKPESIILRIIDLEAFKKYLTEISRAAAALNNFKKDLAFIGKNL